MQAHRIALVTGGACIVPALGLRPFTTVLLCCFVMEAPVNQLCVTHERVVLACRDQVIQATDKHPDCYWSLPCAWPFRYALALAYTFACGNLCIVAGSVMAVKQMRIAHQMVDLQDVISCACICLMNMAASDIHTCQSMHVMDLCDL